MLENLMDLLPTIGGGAISVISVIVALVQKHKKSKVTKCDTIYERMIEDMETAELMYKSIAEKGIDTDTMKKQYVMTDLQLYAYSKGVSFDKELWSAEIERMIKFSKTVNANENYVVEAKATGKVI